MRQALALAERAAQCDEVPVGAIIVLNDTIIGRGYNQNRLLNDPSAHAEILALREAGLALASHRLIGATLYVTVEPCAMCVGAIVHARIKRLVYGVREPNSGAVASAFELLMSDRHNHRVLIHEGVLAEQCGALMTSFFKSKRKTP